MDGAAAGEDDDFAVQVDVAADRGGHVGQFWEAGGLLEVVAAPQARAPPLEAHEGAHAVPLELEGVVCRIRRQRGDRLGQHRLPHVRHRDTQGVEPSTACGSTQPQP